MINDLKLAVKMLKFGLNMKSNITVGIIFFVIGIIGIFALPFTGGHDISSLCGFYMTMAAMYVGQLLMTTTISRLVQTSPYKKKLQTSLLIFCTFISNLILYTVFVLLAKLTTVLFPEQYANPDIMAQLILVVLLTGFIGTFLQIYMAISLKCFAVAYILMLLLVMPVMLIGLGAFKLNWLVDIYYSMSLGKTVAIGYLLIVVGSVLGYICSLLVYRRDISPSSYRAVLRQAK